MTDGKRMGILLGVLFLLAVANVVNWMGDDGFERPGFFSDSTDVGLSPKVMKTVAELERTPVLNFRTDRAWEPVDVVGQRNPFIYGVDRKKEAERKQRLEALEKQREEMSRPAPVVIAPPKPRFDGRVVGVMKGSDQGSSMVSVSYNQEIHILKEGQILADKYRLVTVENERILFQGLETGEEIEIKVQTR